MTWRALAARAYLARSVHRRAAAFGNHDELDGHRADRSDLRAAAIVGHVVPAGRRARLPRRRPSPVAWVRVGTSQPAHTLRRGGTSRRVRALSRGERLGRRVAPHGRAHQPL